MSRKHVLVQVTLNYEPEDLPDRMMPFSFYLRRVRASVKFVGVPEIGVMMGISEKKYDNPGNVLNAVLRKARVYAEEHYAISNQQSSVP
jgi:hypothetical protein